MKEYERLMKVSCLSSDIVKFLWVPQKVQAMQCAIMEPCDSFDTLTQFRGFLCHVDVGTCVRAWWFGFGYQLWLLNLKFQPKGKQNEFLNNRILP